MIEIAAHPRHFPHNGLIAGRGRAHPDRHAARLPGARGLSGGHGLRPCAACAPRSSPPGACLAAARGAGLCILHTRQGYRPDLAEVPAAQAARASQAGQSAIGTPGPLGRFLIRGEPGFQIIAELAPAPGEFIIDKTANSAFWGTDLAAILAAQRHSRPDPGRRHHRRLRPLHAARSQRSRLRMPGGARRLRLRRCRSAPRGAAHGDGGGWRLRRACRCRRHRGGPR